jgi:hypothetical protein
MTDAGVAPLLKASLGRLADHPALRRWASRPRETDEGWPACVIGQGSQLHALAAADAALTGCGLEPTMRLDGLVGLDDPDLCGGCVRALSAQRHEGAGYRDTEDGRTWKPVDMEAWERGVARRIRVAVESSGLANIEIAHALGVSHTTVASWRAGRQTPCAFYLLALGELLDPDDPLYLLGR